MRTTRHELAALLAPGALLALLGLAFGALLAATLEPAERAALGAMLAPRAALLLLGWLVLAMGLGALAGRAYTRYVAAPARRAEAQQVRQHEALRADVAAKVRQAAQGIEQERSRLAALMSELTQSVVVCNLDGRILLYNQHARQQFRALSQAPAVADGGELIGIGRSVYAVFDRQLLAHALASIEQRLQRGEAQASAQFVTSSPSGQLLRVQMAPVREPGAAAARAGAALSGYVLMLENITRDFERDTEHDHLLHGLTESSRASLGNLQAALDMLELPDLEPPMRERFHGVVRDEVAAMSARMLAFAQRTSQGLKTRWPLEEMLGADLVQAAQRHIEARVGLRTAALDVDPGLWLKVDSFALLQALAWLAARLHEEFGLRLLQLRLQRVDGAQGAQGAAPRDAARHAQLDLIWTGHAVSTETLVGWEAQPMTQGRDASPLSVRDVVERHGGEIWFQRERARHETFFRLLLPLAQAQAAEPEPGAGPLSDHDSRPEYYDFDLFRPSAQARELGQRRLVELAYTVFDTETTGLDPAAGDEIIQIGAVRIVNAKLLRHERFEQLVDPGRSIPAAGIAIHGITPAMVAGKAPIGQVLPAFHAVASDTVLVAHNAAFDLRFLQLKEAASGIRFDQPLLDTLLLSAVAQPMQPSHQLEAIAERFGITVAGRHTALGDALLTAEVFLKLLPLLADQGIVTLGQALAAAQQTYYARLKY